jgi:uncharacterized membrane protein YbhN (UPF0104 family)
MSEALARLGRRVPERAQAQATRLRILLGIAISVAFLAVTVSRVDLLLVGRIIVEASLLGVVAGLGVVCGDVAIRALRWQLLLRRFVVVPYRRALAFLCIGYLANTILPARLGDLARAYLAGTAFGAPRLATLGTIMVERVSDGLVMLATVIVVSAFVTTAGALQNTALALLLVGLAGLLVLGVGVLVAGRLRMQETRAGRLVRDFVARVAAGAGALRTVGGAAGIVGLTLAGLGSAVLIVVTVSRAVGLELSPAHAALTTAGLALSLAIPAAPGSLGTYEFVGVSILVALGYPAESALATVVLIHVSASLPPAIGGLIATWVYHVRVGALIERGEQPEAPAA